VGVAHCLEAIADPIVRHGSDGCRPPRHTIQARHPVAQSSQAGAPWVSAGAVVKGITALPPGVIRHSLRQRSKAERLIALVRQRLTAGVRAAGPLRPTDSGTPQGGRAVPLLSQGVLHACDGWLEEPWHAHPLPLTATPQHARANRE
jgi:RNA-directed DNA polymerase